MLSDELQAFSVCAFAPIEIALETGFVRTKLDTPTVIREVGTRLGAGLVGIVNVFNPEVIVIGGGASRSGDMLLDPARAVVAERALRPGRERVRVVPARFGEEAGMLGGALLAMEGGA